MTTPLKILHFQLSNDAFREMLLSIDSVFPFIWELPDYTAEGVTGTSVDAQETKKSPDGLVMPFPTSLTSLNTSQFLRWTVVSAGFFQKWSVNHYF